MRNNSIDEFRDPRIHPRAGDEVLVDLGDGETERRRVTTIERRGGGDHVVRCHIDGDTQHVRDIRLKHWRELADESTVTDVGLPA